MAQRVDGSLGTGSDVQLGVDVIEVEIDGARADRKALGDLLVAQPLGQ